MTEPAFPYRIFPLGDAAFSIEFQQASLLEANELVHFFKPILVNTPFPSFDPSFPPIEHLAFMWT